MDWRLGPEQDADVDIYHGTTQGEEIRRRARINPRTGCPEGNFLRAFHQTLVTLTELFEAALINYPHRGEADDGYWQHVADTSGNKHAFCNIDLARDACLIFSSQKRVFPGYNGSFSEEDMAKVLLSMSRGKSMGWFKPEYRRLLKLIVLFKKVDEKWGDIGDGEEKMVPRVMGRKTNLLWDEYIAGHYGLDE